MEVAGIGFEDLTNTRTISSAQLQLNYWDELSSPSQVKLSSDVAATDAQINLTQAGSAATGDLVQIDMEVVQVVAVLNSGLQYRVTRGVEGSTAATHTAQTPTYKLSKKVFVIPFARDFFGSPASGSFSYPIQLPDARIASADMFVTNAKGNGPVSTACYTNTLTQGLRTLSGGQFTIQVDGGLAIQTDAAPLVVVQEAHSVNDIVAVVNEAPVADPVVLQIRTGSTVYCTLTIEANSRYSNVVDGFGLPPLAEGAELHMDITSVGQTADATPGRDLTVTIRM
jgi:hypothetical protein